MRTAGIFLLPNGTFHFFAQLKLGQDMPVIVQRILPEYVVAAVSTHDTSIGYIVAKEVGASFCERAS